MKKMNVSLNDIISLCKRRGFVYQNSNIYGGLQGVYDYGPLGVELKNNLKNAWWSSMIYERNDIEGLDSAILTNKLVLKHSGHENTFTDSLVDCYKCKHRMRADTIENGKCEYCGSKEFTDPRPFNLLFKTTLGPVAADSSYGYLRPETAQGIFVNFKNLLDSTPRKLPFGIAQIGKAFRNEITPRNFLFRMREFEQMELEFFVEPDSDDFWYQYWIQERYKWWVKQGLSEENLKLQPQKSEELAHYSKATTDILYRYPHGYEELEGIANRTDYDLGSHTKEQDVLNLFSKVQANSDSTMKLAIQNPENGNSFIPFVIEPSAGVDRGVLAILTEAYNIETVENGSERVVLKLKPHLSPIKVAVMPLARNHDEIVSLTESIVKELRTLKIGRVACEYGGNIGKNYRRHDEIGTPFCVTVDYQSIESNNPTVTIRNRDTMQQERVNIQQLCDHIAKYFS